MIEFVINKKRNF